MWGNERERVAWVFSEPESGGLPRRGDGKQETEGVHDTTMGATAGRIGSGTGSLVEQSCA